MKLVNDDGALGVIRYDARAFPMMVLMSGEEGKARMRELGLRLAFELKSVSCDEILALDGTGTTFSVTLPMKVSVKMVEGMMKLIRVRLPNTGSICVFMN